MIPEGYEAIRENLNREEMLTVENAQLVISNLEKDLQLAQVKFQNVMANLGATGDCQIVKDEAGFHLVKQKEAADAPVEPAPTD
jgi:hypothetical protein